MYLLYGTLNNLHHTHYYERRHARFDRLQCSPLVLQTHLDFDSLTQFDIDTLTGARFDWYIEKSLYNAMVLVRATKLRRLKLEDASMKLRLS